MTTVIIDQEALDKIEPRHGLTTVQNHLPDHWISRVQDILELAKGHESLRFFTAWQKAEGGNAKWNPLNSSLKLSGTVEWTEPVDYNSIPVRNYKYAVAGVVATALTLTQRQSDGTYVYPNLLSNLKDASLTAEEIVNESAADIRRWGTSPQTMLDVLKNIS